MKQERKSFLVSILKAAAIVLFALIFINVANPDEQEKILGWMHLDFKIFFVVCVLGVLFLASRLSMRTLILAFIVYVCFARGVFSSEVLSIFGHSAPLNKNYVLYSSAQSSDAIYVHKNFLVLESLYFYVFVASAIASVFSYWHDIGKILARKAAREAEAKVNEQELADEKIS